MEVSSLHHNRTDGRAGRRSEGRTDRPRSHVLAAQRAEEAMTGLCLLHALCEHLYSLCNSCNGCRVYKTTKKWELRPSSTRLVKIFGIVLALCPRSDSLWSVRAKSRAAHQTMRQVENLWKLVNTADGHLTTLNATWHSVMPQPQLLAKTNGISPSPAFSLALALALALAQLSLVGISLEFCICFHSFIVVPGIYS